MSTELNNFSKLAIHTQTHKPWTLEECISHFTAAKVPAISIWRHVLEPMGPKEANKMLSDAGLSVPALVRGGFFVSSIAQKRQDAVDENKACIDEAAAVGADMVVLVVGAAPDVPMADARAQVTEGIAACCDHADAMGVKLAIEPLHPMYAGDRACINRMADARAVCEELRHPMVGVAVDVYHTWWDPDLENEIALAGAMGTLMAFHVCDWRIPTRDMLTDRGLMGDGCIDLPQIRGWMEKAGFDGYHEIEIFSDEFWAMDQAAYLNLLKERYLEFC